MKVLLAFNDDSLGGTSRSALEYAEIWRSAGAEIQVFSTGKVHPARAQHLEILKIPLLRDAREIRLSEATLLHLHHAAPSTKTNRWVSEVLDNLPTPAPAILTHNIFGQDLHTRFPNGQTVIGILGHWLSAQYSFQALLNNQHPQRIMPNPQDFQFFRPPSSDERRMARATRLVDQKRKIILRVGSPNDEKWSTKAYMSLAKRVMRDAELELRLVGCPRSLQEVLPRHPRIVIVPSIHDDMTLRQEYWAADVFAHWAKRGESFGNVLLEASGTGLPVVYKSRILRDNTPWEFRDIESFKYVSRGADWEKLCCDTSTHLVNPTNMSQSRYARNVIIDKLRPLVSYVDTLPLEKQAEKTVEMLLSCLDQPLRLSVEQRVLVGIRHNHLAAHAKAWKLNRKSNV